jgi:hypothetical protein
LGRERKKQKRSEEGEEREEKERINDYSVFLEVQYCRA